MPTYEYKCNQCGHQFEAFQKISDDPLTECPQCGGEIVRLISGGTGLIFKGSGFYLTDYARKNSSSAPKNGKGQTKKDVETSRAKDNKSSESK